MAKKYAKKPPWQAGAKKIALERIAVLFSQAEKEFKAGRPDLANRYVEIARRIGMKTNVPIPPSLKKRFCRKCYSFLVPGKNARIRLDQRRRCVVITCLRCNNKMRFPYKKK